MKADISYLLLLLVLAIAIATTAARVNYMEERIEALEKRIGLDEEASAPAETVK